MTRIDFLKAMQCEGLLDPSDFELRANNPGMFRHTVGSLVKIGYEIEGDTVSTAETVRLLAPGPHVEIWEGQELWHAMVYAEMAHANDIALPDLQYSAPDRHIRLIGKAVGYSDILGRLFGLVVDIEGFKNERQNMAAQNRAASILKGIGEYNLATAFTAMYKQESYHAGYYGQDLKERRAKHPLLFQVAKIITVKDPKPIGANTPERMVRVGAAMKELFRPDELKNLVENIAKHLGLSHRQTLKQLAAIAECVEAFETQLA